MTGRPGATIGLDIGGTRMRVGRRDAQGALQARRISSTRTGPEGVDRLVEHARELAPEGVARVGVSMAGPLDLVQGSVYPLNMPGWHGYHLVDALEQRLSAPVTMDNDANAAALGEWLEGAGQGTRAFVYYTVSTGIGTGVILNGAVLHGAQDTEGGHQIVWPGGPPCLCGARGCLEAVASGTAIRKRFGRRAEEIDDPAVWEEVTGHIAVALANTAALLCPEVIAFGGGVTARGEAFFEPLRRQAAQLIHLGPLPRIVPSGLGLDSGIIGALVLAEAGLPPRSPSG